LPELPNSLQSLSCSDNKLSSLPELPNSLRLLDLDYNQFTSLPKLPNSLEEFYCHNNQLIKKNKYKYFRKIINNFQM
jgi:E3 ubiquitin-protein ligase SspH2